MTGHRTLHAHMSLSALRFALVLGLALMHLVGVVAPRSAHASVLPLGTMMAPMDTDGDGVDDSIDIDDDNDGILDVVESPSQQLAGTSFWITFNPNHPSGTTVFEVYVAGAPGTQVTIGADAPRTIGATGFLSVSRPANNLVAGINSGKAIRVTSDGPITLFGNNFQPFTVDAFTALPDGLLGTEYYAIAHINGEKQIAVTATEDNTTVTLGALAPVTLNTGQTYYYTNQTDFTGMRIVATKPVAVNSGILCTWTGVGACDHVEEQLFPVETWANEFYVPVIPQPTETRVVAAVNGTTVTRNGTVVATLNAGQFYSSNVAPAYITTSNPSQVYLIALGDLTTDPSFILLPGADNGVRDTTFAALRADNTNTVIVSIPTAGVASLRLDGNPVAQAFTPYAGTSFSHAQIPVAYGTHTLTADQSFIPISWGEKQYESYGYVAGYGFNDPTAPPLDSDGDGTPDLRDLDSDNDGIADNIEAQPTGSLTPPSGVDGDGDGLDDAYEGSGDAGLTPIDSDGDNTPGYLDLDSDDDGLTDQSEGATADSDTDGTNNFQEADDDGDGIPTQTEGTTDPDGDGIPNSQDPDSDGDGLGDQGEGTVDGDGDSVPDYLDPKPAAPVITSPAAGSRTNDTTPGVSGTAKAGSMVTVTDGTNTLCTALATGGSWSCDISPAQAAGTYTLSVTATDGGYTSVPSTRTFTIDLTAPDAPVIINPTDGLLTTDTTPTVSGTAEDGSTVTVTDGTNTLCTALATGGSWSCDISPAQADGSLTVSVTTTDSAGNESAAATRTFTIDATAPDAPVIINPAAGLSTADTTPTVSGTAEDGSTVTVTDGTNTLCTALATGGSWSCDIPAQADGSLTLFVTATDSAGNETSASTRTFTIDTTAPDAPVILNPTTGLLTADTTPTVSGTAEDGSTVTITDGTNTLCTALATGGSWSCDIPAQDDGSLTLVVTATDSAGNESAAATRTFTIDATAPDAPVIINPAAGLSTADTTPTVSGTAEDGSTVTITDGTNTLCTLVATGGSWSCDIPAQDDGSLTLVVTATDSAGNESAAATRTFTIDTTAPDAPTISSATLTGDTTPTLFGTAEIGSLVTVSDGTNTLCTATATNTGDWTCDVSPALADDIYTLSITATDAAGNESSASTQSLEIDSSLPAAPTITSPSLTRDATPVLNGTAEPGSSVTVMDGATTLCTVTADSQGDWLCTSSTLIDGTHTISVSSEDAAGNSSSPVTQTLVVDTTAPAAATIASPALTNNGTPTISGSAEAGSTIVVTIDGQIICTVVTGPTGGWSCPVTPALAEGNHSVSVGITDVAGNSGPSTTQTLTVDLTLPAAPVVSSPTSGQPVDANPVYSGTGEVGATIQLTVDRDGDPTTTNDQIVFETTVGADGSWSIDTGTTTPISGIWGDGLTENDTPLVTVVAIDAAGNESDTVETRPIVDITAPALAVITQPSGTTNDTTPTIAGTAEPGTSVTILVDGQVICTTVTSPAGIWNCTPTTPISDGSHQVSVIVTDAAGNSSTALGTLVVNTQVLAAPTINPIAPPAPGQFADNRFPVLNGTAPAGTTLTVVIDPDQDPSTNNSVAYSVPVDANGGWALNTETATPISGSLPSGGFSVGQQITVTAVARNTEGITSETTTQVVTIAFVSILPVVLAP